MFAIYFKWAKRLFDITKKVLFVFVVYLIIIGLFTHFFSNSNTGKSFNPTQYSRQQVYKVINDPQLNKTKEGKTTIAFYRLLMCGFVGEGCTNSPSDGNKNVKKSVVGFTANLMTATYINLPASGMYWVRSNLQNAGFVPKTYAAGIGFSSLSGFIPVWDGFRKIAYLVLVLIIVTIGFMIMFRMKLNPQTVIAIENALPRIIIAILLITFSYAIVGFLIDFMYIIIVVGINLIGKAMSLDPAVYGSKILTSNMFDYVLNGENMATYIAAIGAIFSMLPSLVQVILGLAFSALVTILSVRMLTALSPSFTNLLGNWSVTASFFVGGELKIGNIIGQLIAIAIAFVVGMALAIIFFLLFVVLTLMFLGFRIFFVLLSSLIQVILYLIFAPIILLLEAIPGRSSFTGWLKNIIGNLIVFPAVIFLIMIVNGINKIYLGNSPTFLPPFLSGTNPNAIVPLIDAVMLVMIPDLVKVLKQAIIGKESFGLPISPGALFGAGAAAGGSVTGLMQQLYYMQGGWQAIRGHKVRDEATGGEKYEGGILSGLGSMFKLGGK